MSITPEQVQAVAPHGVWRFRRSLQEWSPWMLIWEEGMPPASPSRTILSPTAVASALNEPLRECGCVKHGVKGYDAQGDRCKPCNGTGSTDDHADLRAFIKGLLNE